MISHGALAESVAALHRGETRRFGLAFRTGTRNFWRVLGQILLFLGIVLGLLLVVGIPLALLVAGAFATDSTALRATAVVVAVLVGVIVPVVFFFTVILGDHD
jgi:ABC-type sugar transport system permease subunit